MATRQPVWLSGEGIARFAADAKIERVWNGCVRWADADGREVRQE
jgi:hypothetical protein